MSATATQWTELSRRTGGGLEAVLLWDESGSRVKVMLDTGTVCHHLEFEIARHDALEAFSRPFSEATEQFRSGRRPMSSDRPSSLYADITDREGTE